ncbi:hypothetical protein GHU18_27920, partial [Pseudomonas aeruginosa]|nr:hypothetical protein [Pseudomonas aeruginosa]
MLPWTKKGPPRAARGAVFNPRRRPRGRPTLAKIGPGPRGERDLGMLDGDTVVFVEVRSRRHRAWGGALE